MKLVMIDDFIDEHSSKLFCKACTLGVMWRIYVIELPDGWWVHRRGDCIAKVREDYPDYKWCE